MLLEGLPSFPEITVTEAHELEVGRIWKPQKGGTWLCFLKLPSSSTRKDTGGGTGLDSSQVLGALDTLRQLDASLGKEKRPKKEVAEEIGWPQELPRQH